MAQYKPCVVICWPMGSKAAQNTLIKLQASALTTQHDEAIYFKREFTCTSAPSEFSGLKHSKFATAVMHRHLMWSGVTQQERDESSFSISFIVWCMEGLVSWKREHILENSSSIFSLCIFVHFPWSALCSQSSIIILLLNLSNPGANRRSDYSIELLSVVKSINYRKIKLFRSHTKSRSELPTSDYYGGKRVNSKAGWILQSLRRITVEIALLNH